MVSQFESDYAVAAGLLFEQLGESDSLVYTWAGTSTTVDAILSDEREEVEEVAGRREVRFVRMATVKKSELSNPVTDATATAAGYVWHVTPVQESDSVHVLKLKRTGSNEVARRQYRGHR